MPFPALMPDLKGLQGRVREHILCICRGLKDYVFDLVPNFAAEMLENSYLFEAIRSLRITHSLSRNGEALADNLEAVVLCPALKT
jgi:hypothetical protein